ncbi:MAG: hypothetical protein UHP28_01965 [Treponema sp.]|nr:hypothetical protein [Treponema sp.]
MQKIKPAKNSIDMDFLNDFDKPIGDQAPAQSTAIQKTAIVSQPVSADPVPASINPVSMEISETDFANDDDDQIVLSKALKTTQIVVRTTEKERDAMKSYFMKHGISLSKGIKIAIKYLEQQEKKGLVHFSDIGLY